MSAIDRWTEPGTTQAYPFAFEAYRRLREAEEKPLPRHQILGGQVDHYVWRRWRVRSSANVDVLLTLRRDASPRIRRIVAAILASIRRGRPPHEAIRLAARRFQLPQSRVRAYLVAHLHFDLRRHEQASGVPGELMSVYPFWDWL
jgi:hypothetical protein